MSSDENLMITKRWF